MIDAKSLRPQVAALEKDLLPTGESDQALRSEWEEARNAGRTAAGFETWLGERVTQVAVAWVLATVFVRFCEDNELIEYPFITGHTTERAAQARELQTRFFETHPEKDDYGWLVAAIGALSASPIVAALFDSAHNPMWSIKPTPFAIKELLAFWRTTGPDGLVVHRFHRDDWDTRFLGDLYQHLSEAARKQYALLQTPEFVEKFILKYTLDEAIEEFGLEPDPPYAHDDVPNRLRLIDPACGSGHFLLGAFDKLLKSWQEKEPSTDKWTLIRNALESIHGVDKNPFAVAIARFRLLIAAMSEAGIKRLDEQVDLPLHIAVGDSLLHGRGAPGTKAAFGHTYKTEDVDDFLKPPVRILSAGSYHVVVGNPPYITPKDRAENENYRAYKSCSGKYALSVPFAERMFQLAIRGAYDGAGAGYVGQITANSFMKREFGKKLIEEYFPNVDLTRVIDTSGAFIPGHGTPTVILVGRRRFARAGSSIRAVLGIEGEPSEPPVPADGYVWKAIENQADKPGSTSGWVSVADMPRDHFAKHPWSLRGGGADEAVKAIERAGKRLAQLVDSIGITSFTLEDGLYLLPTRSAHRHRIPDHWLRDMVIGDGLRDWGEGDFESALFPYDGTFAPIEVDGDLLRLMWPCRTTLSNNFLFGGKTKVQGGLKWTEYGRLTSSKLLSPLSITYAEISTLNHFVLDRGGKIFNRSAPVIKLPLGTTEDDHLALLGVLNSSTTCFWLKQMSHDKGNRGEGGGITSSAWERFYQFNGTKLEKLPLPSTLPLELGRELDSLARELTDVFPAAVCGNGLPTRERLDGARAEYERIRGRMIALQEELDWDVYRRYGLLTDEEGAGAVQAPRSVPDIGLGERAFEVVLARRMRDDGLQTQWFARHRSTPVTEIPARWPAEYKAVVEKRIELIEQNRNIGLFEQPECKRRWSAEPWEDREKAALRDWLLDRCEERALWFGADGQPRPMTVNRLADLLRPDADVVSVARLYAGDADAGLAEVLDKILRDEHVPYLAGLRYKAAGLVKRAVWERVWDLQRKEDAGERVDIEVPPKYSSADFQKPSYWRHRGKLDVPKERFISYPRASPDGDASLLLGWAGWDHLERAKALQGLIDEREATDGWGSDRLRPLIEGLAEVMPWVRQWHDEIDPDFGQSPADAYDAYLAGKRSGLPECRHERAPRAGAERQDQAGAVVLGVADGHDPAVARGLHAGTAVARAVARLAPVHAHRSASSSISVRDAARGRASSRRVSQVWASSSASSVSSMI